VKNLALGVFSAAVLSLVVVPAAHAVTTTTNGLLSVSQGQPTPNEPNIYFDAATNTASGIGHYESQTGTPLFSFTSSTDSLNFANGFATIDAVTGLINALTISSPTGFLFNDLIFQAQGPAGNAATDLSIKASLKGTQVGGTVTIADIGSGANAFLTSIALGGLVDTFTLTSTAGIAQFKQFEVSGLSAVPLPPAALLFVSALVGMGLLTRRRRKANSLVA
jgi:hypothetical protein